MGDSTELADLCVYAILHTDKLLASLKPGGRDTYREGKPWVQATKLLEAAKKEDKRLPVVFACAEAIDMLFGWALLEKIVLDESARETTYTFSKLKKLHVEIPKRSLVKASDGKRLRDDFIRSYAICRTPDFLVEQQRTSAPTEEAEQPPPANVPETVWRQILDRRGKGRFRAALLRAYNGRCAVTGCDAEQAVEAAHIIPYSETASHDVTNGLSLRADIHTLFDLHLLQIEPETHQVVLAAELRGTSYAKLAGDEIHLPTNVSERPNLQTLVQRWEMGKHKRP